MPTRTHAHTNTPLPLSAALQYVDWSETAPPRDEQFPPVVDSSGDVSTEVRPSAPGTAAVLPPGGESVPAALVGQAACTGPPAAQPGSHQHAPVPPLHCAQGYTPEQGAYENRRKSLFFKDEGCRHMYKDHMRTVSGQMPEACKPGLRVIYGYRCRAASASAHRRATEILGSCNG